MPLTNVLSIQIRPERTQRYEELLRQLAEKAVEKKDPGHYTTHQTALGELGWWHFVSQQDDWRGLSALGTPESIVSRVLGEKEGRRWQQEGLECTLAARQEISVDRPDLSYPPDEVRAIHPAAVVTVVRARNGRQEAVEELIRKIAEAIPKVGDAARIITYQTLIGDLAQYWTIRPLADLADLDRQTPAPELLNRAFGSGEGGLIFRNGLEASELTRREIVVFRRDLSNPPN
jgi:hypothetical protein